MYRGWRAVADAISRDRAKRSGFGGVEVAIEVFAWAPGILKSNQASRRRRGVCWVSAGRDEVTAAVEGAMREFLWFQQNDVRPAALGQ